LKQGNSGKSLVLLAHRDDEIFLLPFLLNNGSVEIIYLTNAMNEKSRHSESKKAIAYLNRHTSVRELVISKTALDGSLHNSLNYDLVKNLLEIINSSGSTQIATLDYEGGHQDHDAAAVLSLVVSRLAQLELSLFPTYRKSNHSIFPYQVMSTSYKTFSERNFTILYFKVAMRLIFIYRSQWKTWLGLGPFILKSYLGRHTYYRNGIDLDFCWLDNCFYHNRNRENQNSVFVKLKIFLACQYE